MITKRVLVAHASRDGSAREAADKIAAVLRDAGLNVDVMAAADVGHLRGFDAVVLGGAVSVGRLHKDARRFLQRHEDKLAVRPVAVFTLAARRHEVASSRRQLAHALAKAPHVEPVSVANFGRATDPAAIEDWAAEVATRFAPATAHRSVDSRSTARI